MVSWSAFLIDVCATLTVRAASSDCFGTEAWDTQV